MKTLISWSLLLVSSFFLGSAYGVTCDTSQSNTPSKLIACIKKADLQHYMQDFQNISDSNPDPTLGNHGSRDPGTAGDIASVNYLVQKMSNAGYKVTVQSFPISYPIDTAPPIMSDISPTPQSFTAGNVGQFDQMEFSGSGDITAQVQPVGGIILPPTTLPSSTSGCSASDFAGFVPGRIALIQRGTCFFWQKAQNAQAAGASAVIIFNEGNPGRTGVIAGNLLTQQSILVLETDFATGQLLYNQAQSGTVIVHMKGAASTAVTRTTYNVIADSKWGDPNKVVVVDAHYDPIFGAGMLDNASGSVTILDIALGMKDTPTVNHMRYIWFGGEEEGLYGSMYYVGNLSKTDLNKIVYDIDADVTASPNYFISTIDPISFIANQPTWDTRGARASVLGTNLFNSYLNSIGLPHENTHTEEDINGSDDLAFLESGIPVGSVVTGQGVGKTLAEVALFGGTLGPYENTGTIPGYSATCVDHPFIYCDNLSNVNFDIMLPVTQAFGSAVVSLAFDKNIKTSSGQAVFQPKLPITGELGHFFSK